MSSGSIEDRIILLEQMVRQLEKTSRPDTTPQPWWDRIAGAFKEDPVYVAAMKLGEEIRKADQIEGSGE